MQQHQSDDQALIQGFSQDLPFTQPCPALWVEAGAETVKAGKVARDQLSATRFIYQTRLYEGNHAGHVVGLWGGRHLSHSGFSDPASAWALWLPLARWTRLNMAVCQVEDSIGLGCMPQLC